MWSDWSRCLSGIFPVLFLSELQAVYCSSVVVSIVYMQGCMERGLNMELGSEDMRVQLRQWVNISTQFKGIISSVASYRVKLVLRLD